MSHSRTARSSGYNAHFPVAVARVGKLPGISQAAIVLTTGCKFYVVKFRDFTGPDGLMKEVVGTELMRRLGLPVPAWTPVLITDDFIDHHPGMWFQRRSQNRMKCTRPLSGLHFGSHLTRSDGKCHTYDTIPSEWRSRVVNRDDFAGAIIFDLWTNNCDRRQCVFITNDFGSSLRAVFIDHGHLFGGETGTENTSARLLFGTNVELYRDVWSAKSVAHWREIIESVDDRCLDAVFAKVPEGWAHEGVLTRARRELGARRARLGALIREVDSALREWHPPAFRHPIPIGVCNPAQ